MTRTRTNCIAGATVALLAAWGTISLVGSGTSVSLAQEAAPAAPTADLGRLLKQRLVTQVVTLRVEAHRGEPVAVTGSTTFDRDVETAWLAVVGSDVKFTHSTEKQINRQLVEIEPLPRIVNSRTVEVTGKLGIRDGSGNWDDSYEGTITVAVTAVLSGE